MIDDTTLEESVSIDRSSAIADFMFVILKSKCPTPAEAMLTCYDVMAKIIAHTHPEACPEDEGIKADISTDIFDLVGEYRRILAEGEK